MHFSKYVAYLGDKKTIDVKYEKDSNPEDISKRINNLIKDILIDTHLLDILMKRESGKIMNSRQLEYMTPKYQKRYIWDSAALSNNYNIQVIIVKNYLSKKQNYTFERSLKKAIDNFAKKLQDTVNFSITIENLYGININNFIETDLTEKKFIPIGSKVEGLMTTIDQQLLPSLSIDPYLKLVLIEHDVDFTFIDENGDDIKGIIAAAWGSFVPLVMEKSLNDVDEYNEKLKHITSFLFGSMKTLLGIHSDLLPVYQKTKIPLSEWEIQKYKFRFFVDKVLSTIHHIKSTNSLIHKVENMEISENIASKMNEAIDLLLEELNKFEKTGIIKLDGIKRAAMLSEFVSSDSSLVSLLYFPSDQKIGVYLPIALPALFPVIISLIKLLKKEKN
uniref:DUF3298 domain-containing protein n=1 Tax=Parastrongyloides trichosuri TaxID=131310 RepID=A0A0N4ZUX3_PARTI